MKRIASKKAGPGGPSSYISHNLTRLYMHCNFGLGLSFVLFAFMSLCFLISSLRLALDKKCYVIALCAIYYIFVVKKC